MSSKKGSFALEVAHKCYNCTKKYKEFNMDFDRIEAEMIACATVCVNDFNNEIKDILLVNSANAELPKMLTRFSVKVHCVGLSSDNFGAKQNTNFDIKKVAFYDLAIKLKVHKFDVIIDLKNNSAENYQKNAKK